MTHTVDQRTESCEVCEREANEETKQRAWTAYYSFDIEVGEGEVLRLRVTNTKHIFYEMCECGHTTRQSPHRGEADELWEGIELSEWWGLCCVRSLSL